MTDTEMLNHTEDNEKLQWKQWISHNHLKIVTTIWHMYPHKPISPFTMTENGNSKEASYEISPLIPAALHHSSTENNKLKQVTQYVCTSQPRARWWLLFPQLTGVSVTGVYQKNNWTMSGCKTADNANGKSVSWAMFSPFPRGLIISKPLFLHSGKALYLLYTCTSAWALLLAGDTWVRSHHLWSPAGLKSSVLNHVDSNY